MSVPPLLTELELPALPRSVSVARAGVLAAVGGLVVDRWAIALAVSEAVANTVMHAYRGDAEPGTIRLSVTERAGVVEVVVCDDGPGLTPRRDSPGAGLGIPLMTALADTIAIDTGAGTRVALRFPARTRGGRGASPGRFSFTPATTGAPDSSARGVGAA